MKRVVTATTDFVDLCRKQALKAKRRLEEADAWLRKYKIANNESNKQQCAQYFSEHIARAEDHLKILKSKCKSIDQDFNRKAYMETYADLKDAVDDLKEEFEYLKNPDTDLSWETLSGSDQYAVELAKRYLSEGYMLDRAVHKACNDVNNANVEPEYENEEFYGEEADYERVLEYMRKEAE